MTWKLLNGIAFQIVWWACVLGAAKGSAWLGVLAALLFCTFTLALSSQRAADLRVLAAAVIIGAVVDGLYAWSGWLAYASPFPWASWAPGWILAIWASFALTFNHSLAFLKHRPLLAAALGAVSGPLSYLGAQALGAVEFAPQSAPIVLSLALGWALCLPLLARMGCEPATALRSRAA
jgi:hypothetical protein